VAGPLHGPNINAGEGCVCGGGGMQHCMRNIKISIEFKVERFIIVINVYKYIKIEKGLT